MKREEPFNVLANRNSWDKVPRDPVSTAVAAFVAVEGTLLYTVAYYATQAVISWATSALLSALMPAPPSPKQSLLVNARDAAAPQEITYGTVRKGGPITYLETVDDGDTLYQIILLASHEIEDVEAIYINDEIAILSGDSFGPNNRGREGAGWVLNNNWTDDPGEHEVRILYHRGNQTSITDTFANSSVASMSNTLFAESENFGGTGQPSASSFVGNGMAFLLVRYGYAGSVFQYGLPKITAKIKGKKVYDPRTATTAHSDNAALCIRDYLTSTYGLNDQQVDETSFQVAANDCDEVITLGTTEPWNITDEDNGTYTIGGPLVTNGGVVYRRYRNPFSLDDGRFATTAAEREPGVGSEWQFFWEVYVEKRYTINGVVRADQSYGDVLQQMMTACAGTLFWGGGKWKLQAGVYNSPTKTLTLDDLRSNINLQTRVNLRDQFNRVQGTFVDANQRYIAADYKEVVSEGSGSFTEQDNNVPQSLNLDLPFTTSYATAQRIAKLTLFRGREQMVFTADFGLNAFDVEVGDIIILDFSYQLDGETVNRYGWSNKEFEVLGWNFKSDSEAGDLRIALTLRETSEDAFAWDAEESAIISNDSNLIAKPSVVTNLSAAADGVVNADGTFLNSIAVSWGAVDGASAYVIEHRENTTDYSSGRVEEGDAVTEREQFIYKAHVEILNRQPAQAGFDYYNTGGGSSFTEIEVRAELENSAEIVSNTFGGAAVSRNTASYEITPVKDNTLYDIRVRAISSIGQNGPWTATTFNTAKDDSVPAAPANLVATAGYGGSEITWDEVTSPLSGDEDWATFTSYVVGNTVNNDSVGYICISDHNSNSSTEPGVGTDWELAWEPYVERLKDLFLYEVYRGTATAPTTLVGRVTGESFSDTGLDNTTEYFYRVKARDFSGNVSDYSTEVSVTTKALNEAVSAFLSSDSHLVPSDSDGSNPDFTGASTTMTVFFGTSDDTSEWTFARTDSASVDSNISGNTVTVTALTADTGYVDITASKSGFTDITRRYSLAKAKQGVVGDPGDPGADGTDGTDGTDGADGKDAIKVIVENPVAIVKNTNDGGSSADDYTGTGSIVRVFEGDTELVYDSTPIEGQWEITSITDVGVTAGTVDDSGTFATVGNSSSLIGDVPRQITYNISGRRLNNTLFSAEGYQVVRRVRDGVQPITVLLDNSPTAVPVNAAGTVDYTGTGPTVRVFEGSTELTFDLTPVNGQWEFDGPATVEAGTITVGSYGSGGSINDHSNMTTDTARISYPIIGERLNGDEFTAVGIQNLTKVFDGAAGDQGDTGDTVVSGVVYFQTLQGTAPATPSATSYSTSTGAFTGLTAGWATTPPPVEITDTTVQEWKSVFTVTIDGVTSAQTISFSTPAGAIQVTADIESDNYVTGTSGWQIQRDTGNAEFNDVTIRGTAESSNYVANTTGWQINDDGTAEFNNIDIRDTLQSPNYVLNTSGWQVNSDGSAEFNDVTVRGTLDAANVTVSGTFDANIIKIDGSTLQYDAVSGNILVKDGGIDTTQIANAAVEAGKIASGAVTANEIAAGTITAAEIATNTITASKLTIGDSSLSADENGDLIVQGGNITVLEDNFYTPSFPISGTNSLELVGGALPFIPPTFIAQIQVVVSFGHGYFNLGGGSDGWGYEIYAVDSRSLTAVTADDLVPGSRAQIVTLGTTDWNVVAGTTGVTYAVGDYLDIAEAGTGTGTAYQSNDLDTLKQRNADEVVSGDIIVIDSLGTTTDWNALAGTTGVTYQEGDFFEAVTTGSGDGVVYSDARYTLDARYTTLMSLQDDTPTLVCTMKNVKNFSLDRSWRMPIYVKWVGESSDIRINKCLTSVFLRFK